jgi:hypothetical protein
MQGEKERSRLRDESTMAQNTETTTEVTNPFARTAYKKARKCKETDKRGKKELTSIERAQWDLRGQSGSDLESGDL